MLNTKVDEILFNGDGKVCGIKSGAEEAKAPMIICDPSYVRDLKKTKESGKVIRAICILDHPIPSTNDSSSCQIILPQKQLGRRFGKLILKFLHSFRYLHFNGQLSSCSLLQGTLYRYDFNHSRD